MEKGIDVYIFTYATMGDRSLKLQHIHILIENGPFAKKIYTISSTRQQLVGFYLEKLVQCLIRLCTYPLWLGIITHDQWARDSENYKKKRKLMYSATML